MKNLKISALALSFLIVLLVAGCAEDYKKLSKAQETAGTTNVEPVPGDGAGFLAKTDDGAIWYVYVNVDATFTRKVLMFEGN